MTLENIKEEFLNLVIESSNHLFLRIYLFDNERKPSRVNYWTSNLYEIIKNGGLRLFPFKTKKETGFMYIKATDKYLNPLERDKRIDINNSNQRKEFLTSLVPIILFETGQFTTEAGEQETGRAYDASDILPADLINAIILGSAIINQDIYKIDETTQTSNKNEQENQNPTTDETQRKQSVLETIKGTAKKMADVGGFINETWKRVKGLGRPTMWEMLFTYKTPLYFRGASSATYTINFNINVVGLVSIKKDQTYEIVTFEKIFKNLFNSQNIEQAKKFYIYMYRYACQNYIRLPFRMFQELMMIPSRLRAEVGFRTTNSFAEGNLKILGCFRGLGGITFEDVASDFHTLPLSYSLNISLSETEYYVIGELEGLKYRDMDGTPVRGYPSTPYVKDVIMIKPEDYDKKLEEFKEKEKIEKEQKTTDSEDLSDVYIKAK